MSSTSPRNFNYTLPAHIWATLSDDERNEFARFRRKNLAFKTRLCREFNETGFCSYGAACGFAHSVDELKLVKVGFLNFFPFIKKIFLGQSQSQDCFVPQFYYKWLLQLWRKSLFSFLIYEISYILAPLSIHSY